MFWRLFLIQDFMDDLSSYSLPIWTFALIYRGFSLRMVHKLTLVFSLLYSEGVDELIHIVSIYSLTANFLLILLNFDTKNMNSPLPISRTTTATATMMMTMSTTITTIIIKTKI